MSALVRTTFSLLAATVSLAGCNPSPQVDPQFAEANRLLKSRVASDVILTIDEASESRHPHADGTHSVCGKTRVQQGATDQTERFIVYVRDGDGMGYFDGSSNPELQAQFQKTWDRRCGPNSAAETSSIPPE